MNSSFTLWRNFRVATFDETRDADWGWIESAAMLIRDADGVIEWIGESENAINLPKPSNDIDLGGALVTPSLIDCHTHLVYAGSRAREFEMRLEGASYEDIARAGGGIRSTVAATRAASDETLFVLARERALALMREGVATIEIKSGYGLTEIDEARTLCIARRVGETLGLDVKTTYLAAHALPDEFVGRADDYIDLVCEWMPRLHAEKLIDAVDAFCERIGFTPEQTRRVFECAKSLGIPVKLHAEQLSDQGGAARASEFNALSCDHLEHLSDEGIAAMASAGVTAVLLPGAYYFLRETRLPPVEKLRVAGIPIALATDHNPGSSPTLSPLLMMNMACTLFRMTPLEAWKGFTTNAARALGLHATHGTLKTGRKANFAVWNADHPRELAYSFGQTPVKSLVVNGQRREDIVQ